MVIYKDVPVKIKHKCWHIHRIGGMLHKDFTDDYGDVPVGNYNSETGKFEECVNTRGYAYAARLRKSYRKTRRDLRENVNKGEF